MSANDLMFDCCSFRGNTSLIKEKNCPAASLFTEIIVKLGSIMLMGMLAGFTKAGSCYFMRDQRSNRIAMKAGSLFLFALLQQLRLDIMY